MTGRALAVQGALALAGLSVAYATWQREPDRASDGDAIVVDTTKNELGRVRFEDDNTSVEIEKRKEGGEAGVWLKLLDKTPTTPPVHPGAGPSPAASVSAKPRPLRDLRGDEPAVRLLDQFAPFRSPRAFGTLEAAKLKELGLDQAAKRKLQITARGQTREFVIGSPASAPGENYLRDVRDGRVYVMPRTLLSDLQGAAYRLVDRKVHAFKLGEVNRIVVTAGGKSRALVVTDGLNPSAYKLAPAGAPDKPDEQARNWHDKVWRLFPTEVLGKGEVPASGAPQVAVKVEYFDGKTSLGWIEIAKNDPPTALASVADGKNDGKATTPAKPAAVPELYARSEHTAGWIRLTNDTSPLTDADKIVAAGP